MGKAVQVSLLRKSAISVALITLIPVTAWADKTDTIVDSGLSRIKSGAASQKRIDDIADKTDQILGQYQQQRKMVESLKVYNDRLRRTITAQEEAMVKLANSIEEASLIERQIVPLMMRMIDGLDKFIAADIPFKKAIRMARVERIRGYLTNANVSAAERFRQVLEAYSTENDYGKSISIYTDTLDLDSGALTVNILQVGRSGLYYQTLDGAESGYWDTASGKWLGLDSSHNEGITQAIRITQGKESADLMTLPIVAPEVL